MYKRDFTEEKINFKWMEPSEARKATCQEYDIFEEDSIVFGFNGESKYKHVNLVFSKNKLVIVSTPIGEGIKMLGKGTSYSIISLSEISSYTLSDNSKSGSGFIILICFKSQGSLTFRCIDSTTLEIYKSIQFLNNVIETH